MPNDPSEPTPSDEQPAAADQVPTPEDAPAAAGTGDLVPRP